jgi:glucuronoarabinoxylan endo-1,4-beta-xylanase
MTSAFRIWGAAFLLAACGGAREADDSTRLGRGEAALDASVRYQHISGFGASSAWTLPAASDEFADQLFSIESGIGLSLLRVRITPEGTTDELVTAQKAVARGASVWAAPWSPPKEWKQNSDPANGLWGGQLLAERRGDWAQRLADFAVSMRDAGAPLVALSAQNEPNWTAKWETCTWSPAELTAFVRDDLGPALTSAGVETPILAPETNDWNSLSSFANPLLQDAKAAPFIGPVATHSYGGSAYKYTTPASFGKELWETEVSDSVSTPDSGIDSALRVASMIHEHLTVAEVSAWHYWWLVPVGNNDNSALSANGELTRRAYALGNFSRFVRPGFTRVKVTPSPQSLVELSAFIDASGEQLVLVAINSSSGDVTQSIALSNTSVASFTPYVTSAALALEPGEPVSVADGRASLVLPARSVTTFVAGN